MNLRADLILPEERRSPNVVNLRLIYRIAGIVVPLILIALLGMAVMRMMALSARLSEAESTWAVTEPRKEKAIRVLNQAKINRNILDELKSWRNGSPRWHAQLTALQENISPAIQLRQLRINQSLNVTDTSKLAARNFTMGLSGIASGADAERAVQSLQQLLVEGEAFQERVASSTIPSYRADPGAKALRLFRVEAIYAPLEFKAK